MRVFVFVVRFYGPVSLMESCGAWSVYLTTLLLDRLSPLSGKPVLCTFFTTALLESVEGREMKVGKIGQTVGKMRVCKLLI